ncbi:hypothetical protein GCM10009128_18630 [Psychrosphaera haliotis]|uniref:hypothetical protein n=1 Tax=Psychrosphaera haliotis TaxID=555083 RepID=UPI0031D5EF02
MFNKNLLTLALFSSLSYTAQAKQNDWNFTLGSGYPYFATVGTNYELDDSSNIFVNYKIGLDDGFSIGYEKALENPNHSVGGYIGAVGIKDNKCENIDTTANNNNDDFGTIIGVAFSDALGCALSAVFGDETTQGAALFYGYSFNGLNQSGWKLRFEAGYGENKNREDNVGHLNFSARYQF